MGPWARRLPFHRAKCALPEAERIMKKDEVKRGRAGSAAARARARAPGPAAGEGDDEGEAQAREAALVPSSLTMIATKNKWATLSRTSEPSRTQQTLADPPTASRQIVIIRLKT